MILKKKKKLVVKEQSLLERSFAPKNTLSFTNILAITCKIILQKQNIKKIARSKNIFPSKSTFGSLFNDYVFNHNFFFYFIVGTDHISIKLKIKASFYDVITSTSTQSHT